MRTSSKRGNQTSASSKTSPGNGSALPRVPRRGIVQPKSPESAESTAVSEESPVQVVTIEAEIARLAYFLWEDRGGIGGSPEEDWLRAEQEILARSRA